MHKNVNLIFIFLPLRTPVRAGLGSLLALFVYLPVFTYFFVSQISWIGLDGTANMSEHITGYT